MQTKFYVSRQIFNLIARRHFDDRKQNDGDVVYLLDDKPVFRRVAGRHNFVNGKYEVNTASMPWVITHVEDTNPIFPVLNMHAHDRRVWAFDVQLVEPYGVQLNGKHVRFLFQ